MYVLSAGLTWFMHFSCVERGQEKRKGEPQRTRGRAEDHGVEKRTLWNFNDGVDRTGFYLPRHIN